MGLLLRAGYPDFFKGAEPCSAKQRSCQVNSGALCSLEHIPHLGSFAMSHKPAADGSGPGGPVRW